MARLPGLVHNRFFNAVDITENRDSIDKINTVLFDIDLLFIVIPLKFILIHTLSIRHCRIYVNPLEWIYPNLNSRQPRYH